MRPPTVCGHCKSRQWVREHIHPSDKRTVILCAACAKVLLDERKEKK